MKYLYVLAVAPALLACGPESDPAAFELRAHAFAGSEWSEPVNLGAAINTGAAENHATFSPNGLSLYFTSPRAGGLGANDIWVSRRGCSDCPWEAPVNLGAPVNSVHADAGPHFSLDGHLLFFFSNRPGGQGDRDIYVSRRADPKDDFAWGPPVGLGPGVNTPDFEAGPEYVESAEDGSANFYFGRAPVGSQAFSIYVASVTRDGRTRGPAVLVPELGPGTGVTLRPDGKEVLFLSSRAGTLGLEDLWAATRPSVHEPWSTPQNIGAPANTPFDDRHPSLSSDGRTLLFASDRPGGFGRDDLWMSTRMVSGR